MDQDIRFQIGPAIISTSAATVYFTTPYRSVLRDVRSITQAKMTSASSAAIAVKIGRAHV